MNMIATSLSAGQQHDLRERLIGLLRELHARAEACIEYGESEHPGGVMTWLRIRFIRTAGGMQFGVKEVYASRGEGSGAYFQDGESTASYAMERICHYHRPTRFTQLDKPAKPLQLFWNNTEAMLSIADLMGDAPPFVKDAVVITL